MKEDRNGYGNAGERGQLGVLSVTNLFPDTSRPRFAAFNRQQLAALAGLCELRVIAPVPWPHRLGLLLRGRRPEPPRECRQRMRVEYPIYLYTPLVMRGLYGRFFLASIRGAFERIVAEKRPDVVYATWAYPDCWAATAIARAWGIPVVSRLHGSDIKEYFRHPARKRLILEAMNRSAAVVSVSRDLKRILVGEGVPEEKIEIVYNGVDVSLFHPAVREKARAALGLPDNRRIVLFVGNLKPVKRVDLLIEAYGRIEARGVDLYVIGEGPERSRLEGAAGRLTEDKRVRFMGGIAHDGLGQWYNACDVFCLPSRDEGLPNVLLESFACATPAVASDTGGIPEILTGERGFLFPCGDAAGLAAALDRALAREWDRGAITSPTGSWDENAERLDAILRRAACS